MRLIWWLVIYLSVLDLEAAPQVPASLLGEREEHLEKWQLFKRDFKRSYVSVEEEVARFANFKANVERADQMNAEQIARGSEPIFGVTKFSDWTEEETKRLRGYVKSPFDILESKPHPSYDPSDYSGESLFDDNSVSSMSVSWIGKLTTPVKNQQQCGSCWTFAVSEQTESMAMKNLGISAQLSQGQMVQCDRRGGGCAGGDPEQAMYYVRSVGLSLATDYPYTENMAAGKTDNCDATQISPVITITNVYNFNPYDQENTDKAQIQAVELNMAKYMFAEGPIAICVDASKWGSYTGGVMSAEACDGKTCDHAVQAVGLRTDVDTPYWIVRNSWGPDWGLDGYIYLEYGQNTCVLTSQPLTCDTDIVDPERISANMNMSEL